jgi:hypothetical protein
MMHPPSFQAGHENAKHRNPQSGIREIPQEHPEKSRLSKPLQKQMHIFLKGESFVTGGQLRHLLKPRSPGMQAFPGSEGHPVLSFERGSVVPSEKVNATSLGGFGKSPGYGYLRIQMSSPAVINPVFGIPFVPKITRIGGHPGIHGTIQQKHLHSFSMARLQKFLQKRVGQKFTGHPASGKRNAPGSVVEFPAGHRIPLDALVKPRTEGLHEAVSCGKAVGGTLKGFGFSRKIPLKGETYQMKGGEDLLLFHEIPSQNPAFRPFGRKKMVLLQCQKMQGNFRPLQVFPGSPYRRKLTALPAVPLYGFHHARNFSLQEGRSLSPGIDLNGRKRANHPRHGDAETIRPGNVRHPSYPDTGHQRIDAPVRLLKGRTPSRSGKGLFIGITGKTSKKNGIRGRRHKKILLYREN